jgi:signal transduction histidine kinase
LTAVAVYGRNVRSSPRPPLSKRLRPWHWTAIDYVVAGFLALLVFAIMTRIMETAIVQAPFSAPRYYRGPTLSDPVVALVVAVVAGAVALRRRNPILMLNLMLLGSMLVAFAWGQLALEPNASKSLFLIYFVPVGYVLYLVAATYERTQQAIRVICSVLVVLAGDQILLAVGSGWSPLVVNALLPVVPGLIIAWSIGYIVRQRRRYAVGMQTEAASKAVAEERLRIARELHDVVAHSMSVIAVQAGYGQYVIDTQPADAATALGAIQTTSREALEEMRRMLGVLRQADTGPAPTAPLYPAPGLAGLDRLVNRTSGAGVEVTVRREGTPRDLPASIDMSAYRIVQEALTNVVKHAHASACDVLVRYTDADLVVEITDGGAGVPVLVGAGEEWSAAASGGHGIIGMRERVALTGGRFTAGPLPGYGFQVRATFPLPLPEAP